jgi:polyadenylate-binding protein
VNIRNIDDSVTIQKLDETFSEFGNVTSIDIRMNESGKSLGYGYIQFEKKEDVDKLLNRIESEPIVIAGKKVTIERFKS